jgi:hypothetical protein
VHEKNTVDAEAVASSIVRSLASTAYADADDIPTGVKMIIMMTTPPIRRLWRRFRVALDYCAKKAPEAGVLQGEFQWFGIAIISSLL